MHNIPVVFEKPRLSFASLWLWLCPFIQYFFDIKNFGLKIGHHICCRLGTIVEGYPAFDPWVLAQKLYRFLSLSPKFVVPCLDVLCFLRIPSIMGFLHLLLATILSFFSTIGIADVFLRLGGHFSSNL